MNKEQLGAKALDKKLDTIINPLIDHVIFELNTKGVSQGLEHYRNSLNDLFSIAVLEGVKLAELVDEKMDEELAKKVNFINSMKNPFTKAKEAAARLNLRGGHFKRFVTPDELDEHGNLKK